MLHKHFCPEKRAGEGKIAHKMRIGPAPNRIPHKVTALPGQEYQGRPRSLAVIVAG
jgi:hypothetical protein